MTTTRKTYGVLVADGPTAADETITEYASLRATRAAARRLAASGTECDVVELDGRGPVYADGEMVSETHAPKRTIETHTPPATLAARALGSIRSERKAKSSAANGTRGGRPVLMTLTDDLGRCVGCCEAPGSRAGEIVEYGSRILARTSPDGYVEPQAFRVEGRATLARTRPADRDDIRYHSRAWDIQ